MLYRVYQMVRRLCQHLLRIHMCVCSTFSFSAHSLMEFKAVATPQTAVNGVTMNMDIYVVVS